MAFTLLLLPDPTGDSEFQLLSVATREEERHVSLNDKTIKTVANLTVAVPDAPGNSLPHHLPSVTSNLEAVAVVFSLVVITHEPQKCNVRWCHSQLKRFEMQTEILPETTENLHAMRESN